jgi:hypothetical protein
MPDPRGRQVARRWCSRPSPRCRRIWRSFSSRRRSRARCLRPLRRRPLEAHRHLRRDPRRSRLPRADRNHHCPCRGRSRRCSQSSPRWRPPRRQPRSRRGEEAQDQAEVRGILVEQNVELAGDLAGDRRMRRRRGACGAGHPAGPGRPPHTCKRLAARIGPGKALTGNARKTKRWLQSRTRQPAPSSCSQSFRAAPCSIFSRNCSLFSVQPRQRATFCSPSSCRSSPYMLATQSESTITR